MIFLSLKQKINIKYFMAVYLTALLIYGAFAFAGPMSLLKGAAIVFLYATFDLVWTYLRDKVWYFPLSSFISGFVLSIVSKPDLPIFFIVLLPLLAVCSKQFLHFGKTRHIFNPAAFAMAVTSFFVPVISWWATGWDIVPLVIFSLTGIFILWKQERWHVAIPFLALYSILLFIFLLISGVTSGNIPGILTAQLVNGTLLFFSTVMLIEPMTSAFATQRERIFYGLSVAVFSVGVAAFLRLTNIQNQDPLILGLLIGNLTASLLFLPKRKKDIMQANS